MSRPHYYGTDDVMTFKMPCGKEFVVDKSDAEFVESRAWHSVAGRYAGTSIGRKTICLHRLLLDAKSGEYVDHIDGDGLNNRRSNIRICSQSQNLQNAGIRRDNISGFRGVSKMKNKWQASINIPAVGKLHLGTFSTPKEAAVIYNQAAMEHFGEFAKLNEVEI